MGIRKVLYAVLVLAAAAHAQFLGYVSDQTTSQTLFTNQSANGLSAAVQNIGQSSHAVSYCMNGFIGTISLLGSNDGTFTPNTTAIPLSQANYNTASTFCKVLPVGGYYPALKAQVSNYGAGSITAWYNASGAPVAVAQPAVNSNGPTTPAQCDQTYTGQLVSNTVYVTGTSIQTIWICSMMFSINTLPSVSGLIDVNYGTGTNCGTGNHFMWQIPVLTNSPLNPVVIGGSFGALFTIGAPNSFCIQTTYTGGQVFVSFTYAQGFANP